MNLEQMLQYSVTYGLGIVLSLLGFFLFFWLIKKQHELHRETIQATEKREERLAGLLENQINANTAAIDRLHDSIRSRQLVVDQTFSQLMDANRFQRDEHNSMIEVLTRLSEQIKNVCKSKLL